MIRYLVISIMVVAIFGLLPGLRYLSTTIEAFLLVTASALVMLDIRKVPGIGVLPPLNKYNDVFIVAFVYLWFVLGVVHGSFGIENLIALLRYVVLAYLVAIFFSKRDVEWISRAVVFLGFSQIIIGSFQILNILPWVVTDAALVKEGLYGTFKDNISYAAILLISMIVYAEIISKTSPARAVLVSLLFLCFIFLSGSRAFFLVGFVYFVVAVLKVRIKVLLVACGLSATLLVVSGLNLGATNKDFLFFLSGAYLDMAMHQRLGLLIELLPQMIMSPDVFFGFGSDRDFAVYKIVKSYKFHFLSPDYLPYIIEDVYWLAMLIFYGFIGTFFFLLYLFGIYHTGKNIRKQARKNVATVTVFNWLFFSALALGITGQVFEVKAFSLFFWIYVGALAVERRELHERIAN